MVSSFLQESLKTGLLYSQVQFCSQSFLVIICFMEDNNLTEEYTDSAKISYKEQERKTLDKKRLEEDLGDLTEYEKVTRFKVLRIK